MAGEFVEPLSGDEIVKDVLAQIERRLRLSGNLRSVDAYPRGFDGVITIKLNMHGLDVAKVESEIQIGTPVEDPEAVAVDEKVEIPLETDLQAVRDRADQGTPIVTTDEQGQTGLRRRKYVRPGGSLEHTTSGAAVDLEKV